MKNLFVVLAVFFGGFVLSGTGGIIFALYKLNNIRNVFYIATVVFFAAFVSAALYGLLKAAKASESGGDAPKKDDEKEIIEK